MKTTQVEIPEGYEISDIDKSTGEVSFKKKERKVMELIKTVDDVLADNNINVDDFQKSTEADTPDEVAYKILKLLAKSLNEGWTPDWSNSNEYKYIPWFEMKGSSGFRFLDCDCWLTVSLVGSRLCYKSRELAEHAGKNFTSMYKQYMIID